MGLLEGTASSAARLYMQWVLCTKRSASPSTSLFSACWQAKAEGFLPEVPGSGRWLPCYTCRRPS